MRENEPFEYKNSREFLRVLINRAYLSFGIPLLPFGWLYLELSAHHLKPVISARQITVLTYLILVLMVFFIIAGYRKSSGLIHKARQQPTLFKKLLVYRKAITLRFIYFSIAALIVTLGLYLTASEVISVLFAVVIVIFSINNPTLQGIVRNLHLQDEEKDIILKVKNLNKTT